MVNATAPPGTKVPSRIIMRVTQNADGSIAAVESLSGQPPALVEALAQKTLVGASSEVAGAAEGAATAGRRMALLFKGLKIGGTAAFAIITAYQLFTATPKQRPRVLAAAAGGLAGGALSTYLICNLLLDIETAGWGLLICGFFAGGAGAYAGAKATEAAYDEVTATDLDKAYHALSGKRQNEIGIFNFLVNKMGSDGCIDAAFIGSFMSAFPEWANDTETVMLAAQLADAAIQPVPPAKTLQARSFPAASNVDRERVCPACHGRSLKELVPPTMTPAELKALKDMPTCSSVTGQALDALRSAVKNLPPRQRALVHVPYQPPPKARGSDEHTTAPGSKPPNFGSGVLPTEQEQIGTVCPNCHAPAEGKKLWTDFGPGFGGKPGGQLSDTEYKRLAEWAAAAQTK
jgi:hypothetical protein